ncbi:hypothetical protein DEO72_LG1g2933 [Vigna unguiculata]|uniref:Uncharacterized protein n=1 Tax=Vigna unguiculata TaxID=3917 RepID=A0A4D6KZ55_VIGUN|nr:hypothetical protein DEO72_LG1g2933 [Vigna unguiculata]
MVSQVHPQEQSNHQQQSFFNFNSHGKTQDLMQKERGSDLGKHKNATNGTNEISSAPIKTKSKGQGKDQKDDFNWDSLRIEAQAKAGKREKTTNTMDSLDWDANFLNRLVEEHGSIDLEWLRDVPPDKAEGRDNKPDLGTKLDVVATSSSSLPSFSPSMRELPVPASHYTKSDSLRCELLMRASDACKSPTVQPKGHECLNSDMNVSEKQLFKVSTK